jgi:serine/threonine protein kinase
VATEAPLQAEEDLRELVGTVLAERYRLDSVLGEGGMGLVFKAHHLMLKRDVAVKLLHAELSSNPQISARFDREAQSAARLEHPNIVHVSEYGSTPSGMKYMVMQLLSGCELIDLLDGGPIPPARVVALAIQIFRGLEHAHKHGVIHRDLKPENVFVTTDHEAKEVLKLVDFGIAKLLSNDEEDTARPLTRHGLVFGTPHYMSPEQATGSDIDSRTDLYSAGVMIYEMLAGKLPFDAEDAVALIRMQVGQEAPAFEVDMPGDLAALVFRLLEKDRDERPSSAAEVREQLEQIQETLSAGVPSPVMAAHTRPPPDASKHAEAVSSSMTSSTVAGASPAVPTMAHPTMSGPLSLTQQKWFPYAAGAGAILMITAMAIAFRGGPDDSEDGRAKAGELVPGVAAPDTADPKAGGAADARFADIDKMLSSKNGDSALDLIKPLKDKYPDDPQLLWREGRALTHTRSDKKSLALAAYGDALERDPKLLEDHDFYAELYDLLGARRLRDQALDLALQKMGKQGNKFLLQLVNEQKPARAMGYANRHRALDALAKDPDSAELVDERINWARDLWQSSKGDSPRPCQDFKQALLDIDANAEPYYLSGVTKAKVPKPGDGEDEALCVGLDLMRDHLQTKIEALAATEADTDGEAADGASETGAAAAPKKKKKKSTSSGSKKKKGILGGLGVDFGRPSKPGG